jgi:hypothetical protein
MKLKHIVRFEAGAAEQPWRETGLRERLDPKSELVQSFRSGSRWVFPKKWFVSFLMGRAIVWLTEPFCNLIPEGYEDENGFHYGTPPTSDSPC